MVLFFNNLSFSQSISLFDKILYRCNGLPYSQYGLKGIDLQPTSDGHLISLASRGDSLKLIKYDGIDGTFIHKRSIVSANPISLFLTSLGETIIIYADMNDEVWTSKYDSNFNLLWKTSIGITEVGGATLSPNDEIFLITDPPPPVAGFQMVLLKLNKDGIKSEELVVKNSTFATLFNAAQGNFYPRVSANNNGDISFVVNSWDGSRDISTTMYADSVSWTRNYNYNNTGYGTKNDFGLGTKILDDGNVLSWGLSEGLNGGSSKFVLLKYDHSGVLISENRLEDFPHPIGVVTKFTEQQELIAGFKPQDSTTLFKFNSNGEIIWNKILANKEAFYDIEVSPAGEIYCATMSIDGAQDYTSYIYKFSPNGTLIWKRKYISYFSDWPDQGTRIYNLALSSDNILHYQGYLDDPGLGQICAGAYSCQADYTIDLIRDTIICHFFDTLEFNVPLSSPKVLWSTGDTIHKKTFVKHFSEGDYWVSWLDSNYCSVTDTFTLVYSLCNTVWPGDANNDEIVDMYDLIPIGMYAGKSGPPRDSVSITWDYHYIIPWYDTTYYGMDMSFVDCNGDGIISMMDTNAVIANYGKQSPFKTQSTSSRNPHAPPLFFEKVDIVPGNWITVPIRVGDEDNIVTQLSSLAFNFSFNTNLIDSVIIDIDTSNFFSNYDHQIKFQKITENGGGICFVRTDDTFVSGHGIIGELKVLVSNNCNRFDQLELKISKYRSYDEVGKHISLNPSYDNEFITSTQNELFDPQKRIKCFPTIVDNELKIESRDKGKVMLLDLRGVEILQKEITSGQSIINLNQIPSGAYFLLFSNNESFNQVDVCPLMKQ